MSNVNLLNQWGEFPVGDEHPMQRVVESQKQVTLAECRDKRVAALKRYRESQRVAVPEGYKHCLCCGETKPVSAFHHDRSKGDGRQSYCADCAHEKVRRRKRARIGGA